MTNKILVHIDHTDFKSKDKIKNLLQKNPSFKELKIDNVSNTSNSFYIHGKSDSLDRIEKIINKTFNIQTIIKNNDLDKGKFKHCLNSYKKLNENEQIVSLSNDSITKKVKTSEKMGQKKTSLSQKTTTYIEPNHLPYFYSNQVGQVYGMVPKNSNRVLIGIIELGGGYLSSDLTRYWSTIGLTTIKPIVNSISVDGARNNISDLDSSVEVALDIQVIGGICNYSTINVYFAPNSDQGFYDAIAKAISDKCTSISISWAGPENQWSHNTLNAYNNLFALAVSKGINITVASGDSSSNDGTSSNVVLFPGTSPNVVCCGGTKLQCNTFAYNSQTVESVWYTSPTEGTTAGYSSYFSAPSYQLNNVVGYSSRYRGVVDITGNADPATGYLVILQGVTYIVGGTSATAPLIAGYLSSINCNKFINNIIYPLKGVGFHDITRGNDGSFSASSGYDVCSGWGSVNASVLTNYLR